MLLLLYKQYKIIQNRLLLYLQEICVQNLSSKCQWYLGKSVQSFVEVDIVVNKLHSYIVFKKMSWNTDRLKDNCD